MKCSNCGADLEEDAQFCGRCGMKVENTYISNKNKRNKIWLVGVSGIVVALLLGTYCFKVLNSKETINADSKNDEEVVNITPEERENFMNALEWIDTNSSGGNVIDFSKRIYEPAERNMDLEWDQTLFYYLEDIDPEDHTDGQLIYDNVLKYEFIRKDNGHTVEIEVYREPYSNDIHKIVCIEHQEDNLHIWNYYFVKGELNFAFSYDTQIYTPTYATIGQIGERFYFCKDVMVKYRNIEVPYEKQDYDVQMLDSYDEEFRENWNLKETTVINEAYLVYQLVNDMPKIGYVEGYVYDTENNPLVQEKVCIRSNTYNMTVGEVYTNDEGKYQCIVPADNIGTYEISIGEDQTYIYGIKIEEDTGCYYIQDSYIPQSKGEVYTIKILLCDAISEGSESDEYSRRKRLAGANLKIREGINNQSGNVILECEADGTGYANLELNAGCYTGEVQKEGYETTYFTFAVKRDCLFAQNLSSPILKDNEYRIVLSWDEDPHDLDAHLFTPYWDEDGNMCHIGFYEKKDEHGNTLDVDDMDGYGPETITITDLEEGSYKYYVTDYLNTLNENGNAMDLSKSNAVVSVYGKGGLKYQFAVPRNKKGAIWEVFEIRNKKIIPIQRIYEKADEMSWWYSQGVTGELLNITEEDYETLLSEVSAYVDTLGDCNRPFDLGKDYSYFFWFLYSRCQLIFPESLSSIEIYDVIERLEEDPLGYAKEVSYQRLPAQDVDWVLKNILNQQPDHTVNIHEGDNFVYYYSGYYYYSNINGAADIGAEAASVEKQVVLSNGKLYLEIRMLPVWAEEDTGGNIYAVAQLRRSNGVKYWTLEQISDSPVAISENVIQDEHEQNIYEQNTYLCPDNPYVIGTIREKYHEADPDIGGMDYTYYALDMGQIVTIQMTDAEGYVYDKEFSEIPLAYTEEVEQHIKEQHVNKKVQIKGKGWNSLIGAHCEMLLVEEIQEID